MAMKIRAIVLALAGFVLFLVGKKLLGAVFAVIALGFFLLTRKGGDGNSCGG